MTAPTSIIKIGPSPRLAVAYAGRGDLVLFLHGVGGNRSNWQAQIDALSPYYLAAAWDMRGYGDSEDYPGPMCIRDVCDDVRRVLDHFAAPQAHIVGLSLGGMIAQEFYRYFPDRIKSLVLANTNAGPAADWTPLQKQEFVDLRRTPLMSGLSIMDCAPAIINSLVCDTTSEAVRIDLMESLGKLRQESFLKAVETVVQFNSAEVLATIAIPTLLIGSTDDRVTPIKDIRDMATLIPKARLVEMPGGHLSNLENPDKFSSAIIDFLATIPQGRGIA